MKIAFIGQKGIPAKSGGVEKRAEHLSAELALLGHDVTCYVRSHYTDPAFREYRGVRLIHTRGVKTKHLDAITHTLTATLHAIFVERYDVIHYHALGPGLFSILPRIFSPKTVVIGTFNSRDYFHKKWNLFARSVLHVAERVVCFVPEKTITISKTLFDYAKKTYPKADLTLIPNGAEAYPTESVEFLKNIGVKPKRYILSVSRLVRHKGIHYLIRAFQQMKKTAELPNGYTLVIVGTHAETEEYVDYLKLLARDDRDILFLGERFGRELQELFSHAAVFVQPSEDEGLSHALLEALSYGLPLIASDIPANIEGMGDAGISFENKSVVDLKRKLSSLVNQPEEMARLSLLAKKRAMRHFDWKAIAKEVEALYDSLLRKRYGKRLKYRTFVFSK